MSTMTVTTLRNKINIKHGFPFKGEFFSDEGEYVVLTPGNFHEIGGFKFDASKAKFYSGEIPSDYICHQGDLIVAMTEQAEGLLGSAAIVPEDNRFLHNQRIGLITVNDNEIDKLFLYHLFKSKSVRQQLRRSSSGSKVKHTSPDRIYDVIVSLPSLPAQQKIADVLSALDAKIELNTRLNAELEALARFVFRHWFVENKEVKDWKVGKLGDVAENIRRGTNSDEINPDTHYIGLEHMPRKSIALTDWGNAKELESNKFIFKEGEFLFGKLRPYFHKVGIAPVDGVCSTDILVIVPTSPEWYGYVLGHISSEELTNYASATSTGTKMPRTNWSDIARFSVPMPPVEIARRFSEFFYPITQKIRTNILESQTLAALRDWLLPLLLNGQVTVQ